MKNIDIVLLRSFVAVAETGRMTTAAKVVNVSQSAISQQIKRLEMLFGVELFDREVGAARLTREGEKLIAHAHRIISLNDEMVGQMQGRDFSGEVKLGVPHDIVGMMMPPILRIFRQAHPNVLITLVSDATRTLRALLSERTIDLCLTTDVDRGNRDQYLMTDRLVWVGAKGGDAFRRRPLSVALGQDSCGFRASAVKALNGARIGWRPICQVGSLEPVFATLEADIAIAPFLFRTIPDRLVLLNEPGLPELPEFHVNLRLPARPHTPIAEELARHIKAGFEKRYA